MAGLTSALTVAAAFALAVPIASPLEGWTNFCERQPSLCHASPLEHVVEVSLAGGLLATVHAEVAAALTPQREPAGEDEWRVPVDGYGDCEDHAILYRLLLAQQGVPANAMWFALGEYRMPNGSAELHAILVVATADGFMALDNMASAPLPLADLGYPIHSLEGFGSGEKPWGKVIDPRPAWLQEIEASRPDTPIVWTGATS